MTHSVQMVDTNTLLHHNPTLSRFWRPCSASDCLFLIAGRYPLYLFSIVDLTNDNAALADLVDGHLSLRDDGAGGFMTPSITTSASITAFRVTLKRLQ